jgi:hypothetical protein
MRKEMESHSTYHFRKVTHGFPAAMVRASSNGFMCSCALAGGFFWMTMLLSVTVCPALVVIAFALFGDQTIYGIQLTLLIAPGLFGPIVLVIAIWQGDPHHCENCGKPLPKFWPPRSWQELKQPWRVCPWCSCRLNNSGKRFVERQTQNSA